MRDFVISTDSTAELTEIYIRENEIVIHPIDYVIDGKEYAYGKELMPEKEFYDAMRQGKMPVTGASNPQQITGLMTEKVREGKDILHLSFCSALSSSYNNAALAAELIMEEEAGSRVEVVDTTCVTVGQELIVKKVVDLKKEGKSLDEILVWLAENKKRFVHEFIVADLFHLVRGGRLSKTSALVGSALKIQPYLHVNEEGGLENIAKIRGRKKAIQALVDGMKAKTKTVEVDRVCITHGDCEKEALYLRELIAAEFPKAEIKISYLCPTIGAHTGPGVLVLGYFGDHR